MSRLCLFLLVTLFIGSFSARHPKRFVINLDTPPDQRWNEVVEYHRDVIPGFVKAAQSYVPRQVLPIAFWVAGKLNRFFPDEYAEEIRGSTLLISFVIRNIIRRIAEASGLPLGHVVSMNILYDILAFDRKHILDMGCTSIVAQSRNGTIFHGRNLDYGLSDLLKNVTIIKIMYSGVTFALSSTLFTGQNDAFTLSLNARYSGPYIYNIFMEFFTRFRTPVGFLLREINQMESTNLGSGFIENLLGGAQSSQQSDRMHAADVRTLSNGTWFLVETNFDPWKKDSDKRRIAAQKMLTAMGQEALNADTMMKVLRTHPVKNNETLFSTVMSARFPMLMKNSTFIWD
ncbi:unnamed protein product [Haemonchus placei]|uniref:NAAA-beta domain-containing protein n=1 Tax=Haemonchus placei TaxID=6290 RepID=A0A0N4WS11_HAEPC|nr:unnamed protein product [Haemonchus placei]